MGRNGLISIHTRVGSLKKCTTFDGPHTPNDLFKSPSDIGYDNLNTYILNVQYRGNIVDGH